MNPYEMADLGQSLYANSLTTYAIFLTLVSGYLVVAYTVGSKLDRLPLLIVTALYLITTTNVIGVMNAYNEGAHFLTEQAADSLGLAVPTEYYPADLISFVDGIVVLASLYFMWIMRRSGKR